MSKLVSVTSGVIPAEPGWRVVFKNPKKGERLVAPVVGWYWRVDAWADEDEPPRLDVDEPSGTAMIVGVDGHYVVSVRDFLAGTCGWEVAGLLAPGASVEDCGKPGVDGWIEEKVQRPNEGEV